MNKYQGAFIVIAFLVAGSLIVYSVNSENTKEQDALSQELTQFNPIGQSNPTNVPTPIMEEITELKIEDTELGEGEGIVDGNTAEVHYTGTLLSGVKFDSSLDAGKTFEFKVGAGQVIKGWDQGLLGMKAGGKRKLTIPSVLAYGPSGVEGVIPPNSTLVFEIELVSIK